MEKRYAHLVLRLTNLKTESEENWKTIETAEKTLLQMINARDYDIAHYFTDEPRQDTKTPEAVIVKRKADRQETEEFYLGVRFMVLILYTFSLFVKQECILNSFFLLTRNLGITHWEAI